MIQKEFKGLFLSTNIILMVKLQKGVSRFAALQTFCHTRPLHFPHGKLLGAMS